MVHAINRRAVDTAPEKIDPSRYPFNIPAFANGIHLEFTSKVTFFVGENGSGKSTLLEALAEVCGFNPQGGNRDHNYARFAGTRSFSSPPTRRSS